MNKNEVLDTLKSWLEESDAINDVFLKRAPEQGEATDDRIKYERVKPLVFSMIIPSAERATAIKDFYPSPAACILLYEGDEKGGLVSAGVRLNLSVFDPGEHEKDYLHGDAKKFTPDALGFQTLLSWSDKITRAVAKNNIIKNKIRVKSEKGVKSGVYGVDDSGTVVDTYPFYFGFVDFEIEFAKAAGAKNFDDLL